MRYERQFYAYENCTISFPGIGLAIITLGIEYWYYNYKAPETRVEWADHNKKMVGFFLTLLKNLTTFLKVSEYEKQGRDNNGFKTEYSGEYM